MKNLRQGGLGANIGSEQWEKANKKKLIASTYSNNLRSMNS